MLLYHVVVVLLPPLLQEYVAPAYVPGIYPPFDIVKRLQKLLGTIVGIPAQVDPRPIDTACSTVFEMVTVVVVDCDQRTRALQINDKKQNAKGRADRIRGSLIVHSRNPSGCQLPAA